MPYSTIAGAALLLCLFVPAHGLLWLGLWACATVGVLTLHYEREIAKLRVEVPIALKDAPSWQRTEDIAKSIAFMRARKNGRLTPVIADGPSALYINTVLEELWEKDRAEIRYLTRARIPQYRLRTTA